MIVDTSALLALFDVDEPDHRAVSAVLNDTSESLVVSPFVVAELDYSSRPVRAYQKSSRCSASCLVERGNCRQSTPRTLKQAASFIDRYRDQQIGIADASIAVLADRHGTRTIVTLDHRHFDVIRRLSGGRFRVLP